MSISQGGDSTCRQSYGDDGQKGLLCYDDYSNDAADDDDVADDDGNDNKLWEIMFEHD